MQPCLRYTGGTYLTLLNTLANMGEHDKTYHLVLPLKNNTLIEMLTAAFSVLVLVNELYQIQRNIALHMPLCKRKLSLNDLLSMEDTVAQAT